jgi:amino acid adenylation domain-containing protein
MERSAGRVAACLAVLVAGGAFLPVDPRDPAARVSWVLADSGARVAVCDRPHPWQSAAECRVLRIGDGHRLDMEHRPDGSCRRPAEFPGPGATPGDLAYVIYTSGSTGSPKGVMIEHRAVCNRLLWMQERFQVSSGTRVLHKSSPSFDVSLWEIFLPLISGGVLVLAPPGCETSPLKLRKVIASESVAIAHFVPSMLRVFLEETGATPVAGLEKLVSSGEVLDADLARAVVRRLGVRLENLYGPTEAAIDATAWSWHERPDGLVPIGRPISNMRTYILDHELRPVPAGVAGEIVLGGAGLARGYLGRADLTAKVFVSDQLSGREGERLYRTGDVGRFLPDGNIQFLGRTDDQVKILGHRIELAEIEAAIRRHPAVTDSAVMVESASHGHHRLVAYFVARADAPSARELRAFLSAYLTAAMVPAFFSQVPLIPRTLSGKVDRQALRPARSYHPSGTGPLPGTELEKTIAGVWKEVLGLPEVGIHEHFIDLGGDSLLGARVIARLAARLHVELGVADLVTTGTIAGLAAQLAAGPGAGMTITRDTENDLLPIT